MQGKDIPKDGEFKIIDFKEEFGSKVAALLTRMTRPFWSNGRTVMMDSGFRYIPLVVQLQAKDVFSTKAIKNMHIGQSIRMHKRQLTRCKGRMLGLVVLEKVNTKLMVSAIN